MEHFAKLLFCSGANHNSKNQISKNLRYFITSHKGKPKAIQFYQTIRKFEKDPASRTGVQLYASDIYKIEISNLSCLNSLNTKVAII